MTIQDTRQRPDAGCVFGDAQVHAFPGDDRVAACDAGMLMRSTEGAFDAAALGAAACQMCAYLLDAPGAGRYLGR